MQKRHSAIYETMLYCLLALPVGAIVGAFTCLFGRVLIWVGNLRDAHLTLFLPFLPLAGLLILLIYRINPESQKGMSLVFATGLGENRKIPLWLVPLVTVTTWITHLFGGSAGREGVAVQIGATVAHNIGRRLKLPNNAQILLVVGMAAGFGGLFRTPFAAAFFAAEILTSGFLNWPALLPALVASCTASAVSGYLGLAKFSVTITDALELNVLNLGKIVLIAIAFGLAGRLFSFLLHYGKLYLAKWLPNPNKRIFITTCVLVVLLFILQNGRYCGLGTNLIAGSFTGETIFGYDFILKLILTVITLSAGFQGGEVTPLFAIGASLGVVLAQALGLPIMLMAALGYASVFGSATNSLLGPMLIGAEVFGSQYVLLFSAVCMIAKCCNGNHSIYEKQQIIPETASIERNDDAERAYTKSA